MTQLVQDINTLITQHTDTEIKKFLTFITEHCDMQYNHLLEIYHLYTGYSSKEILYKTDHCCYIFRRGNNTGKTCTLAAKSDGKYCSKHYKQFEKPSALLTEFETILTAIETDKEDDIEEEEEAGEDIELEDAFEEDYEEF